MKRTDVRQSSEESPLRRKAIVAVEYLVIAILGGGIFYVASLFTLFAQPSPVNQHHSQRKLSRVVVEEPLDRLPSTRVTQTTTTSGPWGIAFDSLHEIVWVAEPGCEPRPTCSKPAPGIIGEYDLLDGSFIQDFSEPPGYTSPAFVAVDASGNVWFTEPDSDAIGELDPQDTTWSQWSVLKGSVPFDLVFDTYGNLWFTEFEANRIGFFNPHTHKLVENAIPTLNSNPYGITRGPRGDIWFTENRLGVGQIGSLMPTPSGTVTVVEHAVTTAQPHLIIADKTGNIWYSEAFRGSIGEYSPASGSSINYPVSAGICAHLSACGTHISGIGIDQKGNIWFDDSLSKRVGYLIPSTGQVIAKTLSNQNSGAYDGLVVDRYNNVWFTELYSSQMVMWPKGTVK